MWFSSPFTLVVISLLGISELVSAHCVIVKAIGSENETIAGHGMGYNENGNRKSTHFDPGQLDVPVFNKKVVHHGWHHGYLGTGCGNSANSVVGWVQKHNHASWMHVANKRLGWPWPSQPTMPGGEINITGSIDHLAWLEWGQKPRKDNVNLIHGIPKVKAGGILKISVWQVNADGGGPFSCVIDYQGNAKQWEKNPNKVGHNLDLPRHNGNCLGNAHSVRPAHHPAPCEFTLTLPDNLDCKGVYGAKGDTKNICIVRCQNHAKNGPFGGCVAIQQVRPVVVEKPLVEEAPASLVVVPPQAVTVTENNVITIIKGGHTKVSTITKNGVITVTQVIKSRPPKGKVSIKTVYIKTKILPTNKPSEITKPVEPSDRPNPDQTPTEEELEAGLGGEEYDQEDIDEMKNTPITEEEKEKIQEQVEVEKEEQEKKEEGNGGTSTEDDDAAYFRKFRFHRD
ncbi:hypothetical protein TWF718_009642 [Orbilia javanica]|uniref:Uncharacterized protein n=1 Tax=Orbilia javanica TaxID=47235 RepID=A0AAN8MWC5_9PEZI